MAVTAKSCEDHRLLAGLLRLQRLTDRERDRMGRLRRRDDALGARELDRSREALRLRNSLGLHEPELVDMRDERRHAVVTKATGMDRVGDEVVPERVHLHERGHASRVAEVVGVDPTGERRAGGWLRSDDARAHPALELLLEEGERQSGEVRAAARAADDVGRGVASHRKLQHRLLADDRLVQQHVVED